MSGEEVPKEVKDLVGKIREDGGEVLSVYREPFGNNWQIFALLPLNRVKPTPFQRDLSPQHVERLKEVIAELRRFIDPIVVVRTESGEYWTPNGNHRREAMVRLGAKFIPCIVIPDVKVAYHILTLNTEKAHNLKEKALEVIRMYKSLLDFDMKETDMSFHFEEAYLITLGIIYESQEKFSGSAYVPILRKVDDFLDLPIKEAYEERKRRSEKLLELDSKVMPVVQSLRARGFNQPFLKQAVVSKINPVKRKRIVTMGFYEVIEKMIEALEGIDVESITLEELSSAAYS